VNDLIFATACAVFVAAVAVIQWLWPARGDD
jgi:hypothetical protein